MTKLQLLAVGVGIAMMVPAASFACDPAEAHFSGHSQHASAPGVFGIGEVVTAYEVIDAVQVNPWYPWNQAAFEYTLVLSVPVSAYANIPLGGSSFLRQVGFGPGTFAFYEDAGTAADYADLGTFTDGTAILTGTITAMSAEGIVDGLAPETLGATGTATITGGPGLGSVICTQLTMNDFFAWLPATSPAGFQEAYDSKWECCVVTSVEPSTWGRMKGLYR